MHRYIVYLLAILMFPICLWLATIWPAWYWGVGLTAAMVALGTWDLLQKRSTLRRNYPVMAHFRYGLESIGRRSASTSCRATWRTCRSRASSVH
jgi:hypothetical protein